MVQTQQQSRFKLALATVAVLFCQPVYMFYATARAVALPTILSEFNGMNLYSITVILGSMTMALVTPFAGKLGDIFGRKRVMVLSLAAFCFTVVLLGSAVNLPMLITGIASCGIACGIAYTQVLALMADLYSESVRPRIISYTAVINSAACLLGPVLGGLCADRLSWRAIFVIMFPLTVMNLVCAWVGMPDVKPVASSTKVDYAGLVLFITCVFPFLYTLTSAGSLFPWVSVQTGALLAVSAVSLVLLLKVEKKAENPILPLALLKQPIFLLCIGGSVASALCYAGINYLPMFYQVVYGMSSTMSGFMAIPRQASMMLFSLAAGAYLSRRSNYRFANILTMALFIAAILFFVNYSPLVPVALICVAEFLYGSADGLAIVQGSSMGQHYLGYKDMGSGMAFISFAGTIGTSLGSAVFGCIVNQCWNAEKLLPAPLYSALSPQQRTALSNATTLNDPEALGQIAAELPAELQQSFVQGVELLKQGLNTGITTAFAVMGGVCVAMLAAVLLFRWEKYGKKAG